METTIEIFTNDELARLDVPILEFINNDSTLHLEGVHNISEKLTERAYTMLGLIIAVYTLLLGIVAYFCDKQAIPIIILLVFFLVSIAFIGMVIKPYSFSIPGMTPDQFKKYIQWDKTDIYREALILSIYTNKEKIIFNDKSNDKRTKYYIISLIILLLSFVTTSLSIIVF